MAHRFTEEAVRRLIPVVCAVLCLVFAAAASAEQQQAIIVRKIVQRMEENEKRTHDYGYLQDSYLTLLDKDGNVRGRVKRTFRITWVENEPFAELIKINDRPLSAQTRSEEIKRKEEFGKEVREHSDHDPDGNEIEFHARDFAQKFDFRLLPSDGTSAYRISFQPKSGDVRERDREERVVNRLRGTLWADENGNVLRIQATLSNPVSFGLGILGSADAVSFDYRQQEFQGVWLPHRMDLAFKARIFLAHRHERQTDYFYSPYRRRQHAQQ